MRVDWVKPRGFKLKSWKKCQIDYYIWVTLNGTGSIVNSRNKTKQYFFSLSLHLYIFFNKLKYTAVKNKLLVVDVSDLRF